MEYHNPKLELKPLCYVKTFEQLTNHELYRILQARVNIFIVEQNCIYPDIDNVDFHANHLFYKEGEEILAYCRMYQDDEWENSVKIGRVITVERGKGLGLEMMLEAVSLTKTLYDCQRIHIHAQEYARGFYEKAGFAVTDPVTFLEDGIPHFHMGISGENQ